MSPELRAAMQRWIPNRTPQACATALRSRAMQQSLQATHSAWMRALQEQLAALRDQRARTMAEYPNRPLKHRTAVSLTSTMLRSERVERSAT